MRNPIGTFQDHQEDNASFLITISEILTRKFLIYITVKDVLLLRPLVTIRIVRTRKSYLDDIMEQDIQTTIAYSTSTFQTKTSAF